MCSLLRLCSEDKNSAPSFSTSSVSIYCFSFSKAKLWNICFPDLTSSLVVSSIRFALLVYARLQLKWYLTSFAEKFIPAILVNIASSCNILAAFRTLSSPLSVSQLLRYSSLPLNRRLRWWGQKIHFSSNTPELLVTVCVTSHRNWWSLGILDVKSSLISTLGMAIKRL